MTATGTPAGIRPLLGACRAPSDKSISHRAAILAALGHGESRIQGFSGARDCRATLEVLSALGVRIDEREDDILVRGTGVLGRLGSVSFELDCHRSGTTMRLLAGAVAGFPLRATLTGDEQLLRRPMQRVAEPLSDMGARVGLAGGGRPPMEIEGGDLRGIELRLPVPSAQVKSAVLLAGLRAGGSTVVLEPIPTRDHTERMLAAMGARIRCHAADVRRIELDPGELDPLDLAVPGDPSSAAFLLAATVLVPGSDLTIEGLGLNPTRIGFLRALQRMGASLEVREEVERGGEPVGAVRAAASSLMATSVEAPEVPSLIDELPLLGLVATQAEGDTMVRGAGELRLKESDRIRGLVDGLRRLGATIEELPDGFVVHGPTPLGGGSVDALHDHRLAMTFAVAGLITAEPVQVQGIEDSADSFPGFLDVLGGLQGGGLQGGGLQGGCAG